MTELLLPSLPLGDPTAFLDPTPHAARWSPIPSSARLSRIRAFGSGAPEPPPPASMHLGTTPVLAKHILDGDVPTTVFSTRLDFALDLENQDLAPLNLFPMARHELEKEPVQKDVVQQIDDKVAKMMQMHLMIRPSVAACTPSRHLPLSPSGLGLSSAQWREQEDVCDEWSDDDGDSDFTPDFDAEETADVTKFRREAGAERMVDLFCEIIHRWQTASLFAVWKASYPLFRMRKQRVLQGLQTSISAWLQHVITLKLARVKADAGEKIVLVLASLFGLTRSLPNAAYRSRELAKRGRSPTIFYLHRWRDIGPQRRYFEARAMTIILDRCIRSSTAQVLKAWRARAVERPLLSTGPRGIFGEGSQEQGLFSLQHRLRALVKVR